MDDGWMDGGWMMDDGWMDRWMMEIIGRRKERLGWGGRGEKKIRPFSKP